MRKQTEGLCDECTNPMDCGSWNYCSRHGHEVLPEGFIERLTYSAEVKQLKLDMMKSQMSGVLADAQKLAKEWKETIATIEYAPLIDFAKK